MSFIKKIRIQNFKSLEDITINVKPINFLFGPNSSGKSSVIKALMFLKNNLYSSNYGNAKYKFSDEIDLISYKDLVSKNDVRKKITFELNLVGNYLFYKAPFADNSPFYHIDNEGYKVERELHIEYSFDTNIKIEFGESEDNEKLVQISIEDRLNNNRS